MDERFVEALCSSDLDKLRQIPKSDLHNHITRGGNKRDIERWSGAQIPDCPTFEDLGEMNRWNAAYIKPLFAGRSGYEKRIEAAFAQAKSDGVTVLHMSVTLGEELWFDGSPERLARAVQDIHRRVAPEIEFVPEIAFLTEGSPKEWSGKLDGFLELDYFRSMDAFGEESNLFAFKELFRKGKRKGLILKAHVGEFGTAELVRRAAEELELDQIQHGIAAADSPEVMRWLADRRIRLNVCPTSNVKLKRVRDYASHPIRVLYDHRVPVTINTDDMLIFDQSVSQEFLNLYQAGRFDAEELNAIRKTGLVPA